jgi:predicted DCC family thiol-disulfide oxidoreductase YuxK
MGDFSQLSRKLGSDESVLTVIYDGQCIFCASYVAFMRLRDAVGQVRLIDARTNGIAAEVRNALQLDLDEGMLVLYGGRAYYGADAMHVLAELTSTSDRWNAAMAFIFRHQWLTDLIYPGLRFGRRLVLFFRGRSLINPKGRRRPSASLADFFEGLVPQVSARTLGACRILVGALMLYFLAQELPAALSRIATVGPRSLLPLTEMLNVGGGLTALSASAEFREAFSMVVLLLAGTFTVGLFTRLVTPVLVLSLWLTAMLANWGHFITPLLLGLTVTAFAPWGDALSIDVLIRGKHSQHRSRLYGYPMWLLGLCIGLAYASAGLTKIIRTDGSWIWNTGARIGFIEDAFNGVSDLGFVASNNYLLAVVASVFAAFGQMAYLYASFTKSAWVKYAICFLIALPFLIGLMLTMGLFWWPWAILVLVLYLPWRSIDRLITSAAKPTSISSWGRQRTLFVGATCGLIALHLFAVLSKREFEPLYSNYPMYAGELRAGTKAEAQFWREYSAENRNWRPALRIVTKARTLDISSRYSIAAFGARYHLYRSAYADFLAKDLLAAADFVPDRPLCENLRKAAKHAIGTDVIAIMYGKRYYNLVDGVLSWLPEDEIKWVTIDLRDCSLGMEKATLSAVRSPIGAALANDAQREAH